MSIFLLALGAILAFAVEVDARGIDLDTVGVILMIIGTIGIVTSMFLWDRMGFGSYGRSRSVVRDDLVEEPVSNRRVVRERRVVRDDVI